LMNSNVSFEGFTANFKGSAVQFSGVFSMPVSTSTALFARLGVNRLASKISARGLTFKDSDTGAFFGLGVDYKVSDQVALRAEFQKPASDTRVFSVGVQYGF
jgi:Outer membrane protein beta-barrel domain